MRRTPLLPVRALRVVLVAGVLGLVLLQVLVLPLLAAESALTYPELAWLRWPALALALAVVGCVQVGAVCVWRLLSRVQADAIFDAAALRDVDVFTGAAALATTLVLGVSLALTFVAGEGNPGTVLGSGALVVAGAGVTLLMVVMRALLVQATQQHDELAEVV
ncbi:DUF2975 domain-containing protein [Pseudokineococcus sp. 1T1Z-3]|uniref:DUF2975 domain-containing protein n=1 Tax=Pseudokineococcus sp. 1T1Z-3 TaxID=3132745 RepID=UPI0030A6116A